MRVQGINAQRMVVSAWASTLSFVSLGENFLRWYLWILSFVTSVPCGSSRSLFVSAVNLVILLYRRWVVDVFGEFSFVYLFKSSALPGLNKHSGGESLLYL